MSERARTLVYALLALAVLAALVFGVPVRDDGYRPVTTETDVSGLAALERWLTGAGVTVRATAAGWEALPEGAGHVLLVHSPPRRPPTASGYGALRDWVRAGNRLVVADFGNEEFPPSRRSMPRLLRGQAPGLVLEDAALEDPVLAGVQASPFADVPFWVRALGGLEARSLVPASGHPLLAGVGRLAVIGDLHGHRWRQQQGEDAFPWLPLLRDAASGGEVAWLRRFGDGEILVTLHPSLFSNGALGRADNARLARNLLTPVAGSVLLLDDHHQRRAPPGAGDLLLRDGRLHATLAALLLFWLLWLLADDGAWERRVVPRPRPERRRADLVRAVGGFLARHMDERAAAEQLLAPVRRRLAVRHGVPEAEALARLSVDPAVDAERRRAWATLLDRMRGGRRVSLAKVRTMTLDLLERLP